MCRRPVTRFVRVSPRNRSGAAPRRRRLDVQRHLDANAGRLFTQNGRWERTSRRSWLRFANAAVGGFGIFGSASLLVLSCRLVVWSALRAAPSIIVLVYSSQVSSGRARVLRPYLPVTLRAPGIRRPYSANWLKLSVPKPTSFAKRVLKEPKSTLKMLHYTLFEDHGRRVLVVVHEQITNRREFRRGQLPRRRQLRRRRWRPRREWWNSPVLTAFRHFHRDHHRRA